MNRAILAVLACCITLILAACTTAVSTLPPTAKNRDWTAQDLAGLRMTLIDPDRVEYMSFMSSGDVAITIGRKKGSVAAPIFKWRIVSGRLRLTDFDNSFYEELTLFSRDRSKIVARRHSGEVATYKIH